MGVVPHQRPDSVSPWNKQPKSTAHRKATLPSPTPPGPWGQPLPRRGGVGRLGRRDTHLGQNQEHVAATAVPRLGLGAGLGVALCGPGLRNKAQYCPPARPVAGCGGVGWGGLGQRCSPKGARTGGPWYTASRATTVSCGGHSGAGADTQAKRKGSRAPPESHCQYHLLPHSHLFKNDLA